MHRAPATTALILWLWAVGCASVETAPTDTRPAEAQRALDEGVRLAEAGKYAEAEPLLRRALELREEALGAKHLDVAAALNSLANVYADQRLTAKAEPLHERALAIREEALGKQHPQVASSLNNL